ncbi:MAG TPA: plastocyanin/azurin family copper-binding protein [Ktedonobacterales bacterium]|nr:plastocyanin/azurin family copper-binding protein [Ktedonobacterales bacterium]
MSFARLKKASHLLILPLLMLAGTLALAPGAMASPAHHTQQPITWHVNVSFETAHHRMDGMVFLPSEVWINQGDTIVWTVKSGEIHTVTLLASGQQQPPFNPGDPAQLFPQGGSTYDGHSYFNSGIMTTLPEASGFGFAAQTYKLAFGATGDFTALCLVHPGMAMTIHVRPAGTEYPFTQQQYDAQNARTRAQLIAQGNRLASEARRISNNHFVVVGTGNDMVDVMRFFPKTVRIHVGETIGFSNHSMGPHTVTFGAEQANIFVPYGDPTHFDGSSPLNSGLLFGPAPFSVTFTKPGTYHYFCALHDYLGMVGTVIVLP